jgi:hypothetical protein
MNMEKHGIKVWKEAKIDIKSTSTNTEIKDDHHWAHQNRTELRFTDSYYIFCIFKCFVCYCRKSEGDTHFVPNASVKVN